MTLRKTYMPLLCFALLGYFAYHLFVSEHGLDERARQQARVSALEGELRGLQAVRERLDRDVALMRADKLDPDMLDERARIILDFSHPNDIVIMNKSSTAMPKP
jgi:cell division protein FtsB